MSQTNRNAIRNRREKDRKRRKKLRDRLEAKGVPVEKIEQIVEQRRIDDHARRHGYTGRVYEYDPENDQGYYPDDTGYEPSLGDPLLRGAGRATGMAAKVVKRRETITDWQYDRETEGGSV